jgi:hypothetical protein
MIFYLFFSIIPFVFCQSDGDCSFCQYLVMQVELVLSSNNTESGIIAALANLCTFIPSPDSQKKVSSIIHSDFTYV